MPKILVTDLDGTLFYPKKRITYISKKNLSFLRDWVDAGNKLVVASGRNYEESQKIIKKVNRPLTFIGCNSAIIFEDGKLVYENPFNGDDILKLMEHLEARFDVSNYVVFSEDHNCLITTLKNKALFRVLYPFWALSQGAYKEPYEIVKKNAFLNEVKNGKIYKVMCFFGIGHKNSVRASLIAKYLGKTEKNFESNWSSISIEFNTKGCTKAFGIKKFLEMHNYSKDDVYVIGDSGNDVCMFKEFYENSFCMAHSNSSIKKYAKTIVENVYDLRKYIL